VKRVSDKQRIELEKRRLLKYQLYLRQDGQCAECGKYLSYYNETSDNYPHLSHDKSLAQGGKTNEKDCSVKCAECHSKKHNLRNIYNEQPAWGY